MFKHAQAGGYEVDMSFLVDIRFELEVVYGKIDSKFKSLKA